MLKINHGDLNFPQGLNLNILSTILPKDKLFTLMMKYSGKKRMERRIVLPSAKTIRKVYSHYIYKRILEGNLSWEEFKKDLRKDLGTIKAVGFSKHNVRKFYHQREKEIERESN